MIFSIILLCIAVISAYCAGYQHGRRSALPPDHKSAAEFRGLLAEYGHGLKDGESL